MEAEKDAPAKDAALRSMTTTALEIIADDLSRTYRGRTRGTADPLVGLARIRGIGNVSEASIKAELRRRASTGP